MPKGYKDKISPISGSFDDVVGAIVDPAPIEGNDFKYLGSVSTEYPAP